MEQAVAAAGALQLQSFSLAGAAAGRAVLRALPAWHLTRLHVELSALQLLTRLELAVHRVQLQHLPQLPQLQVLHVCCIKSLPHDQLQLGHLTSVTQAHLVSEVTSSKGSHSLQPLLGLSRLQKLHLQMPGTISAAAALAQLRALSSLQELGLSCGSLTALTANTSLSACNEQQHGQISQQLEPPVLSCKGISDPCLQDALLRHPSISQHQQVVARLLQASRELQAAVGQRGAGQLPLMLQPRKQQQVHLTVAAATRQEAAANGAAAATAAPAGDQLPLNLRDLVWLASYPTGFATLFNAAYGIQPLLAPSRLERLHVQMPDMNRPRPGAEPVGRLRQFSMSCIEGDAIAHCAHV
ncbi:hypothetical protein COO60DRAFT_1626686 [Scenedesmus sp. NREL 46B-D3]|nr:hypothetical protein COO60DRAFT_1626686 [Scenedesmus sp. NREL 46B-D3]